MLGKIYTKCGGKLTVVFADVPRLGPLRGWPEGYAFPPHGRIPWDDPRTGERNSLRGVNWGINFVAYFCVQERTPGTFLLPPLRHLYWSIQFAATIDPTRSLGVRGTVQVSKVQRSRVQDG